MAQNHHPHQYKPIKRRKTKASAIPRDILIFDILTRLPVKSLLRFKAVVKSWHDIISDPAFVTAHLDQSRKSRKIAIIPLPPRDQGNIIIYSLEGGLGNSSASFLFGKSLDYGLHRSGPVRHQNGLFLLDALTELIVCNPSTRNSTTLPRGSHNALPCRYATLRAGFGFVRGSDVYKVAQYFYRAYDYRERNCSMGFEVFTCGIDRSWRVAAKDPPYPIKVPSFAVSAGGAIYFEVDNSLHTSSPEFILSFDLTDEEFTVIPPPPGFRSLHHGSSSLLGSKSSRCCFRLEELDDSLCFIVHWYEEGKYDIWMYKRYPGHTWIHSFTIKFPKNPKHLSLVTMRDGKLLLAIDDGGYKLEWFDPQNKSLETMLHLAKDLFYCGPWGFIPGYFGRCGLFPVLSYVESLVAVKPRRWSYYR